MAIKFMDFLLFTFKNTQILLNSFTLLWTSSTHSNTNWMHSTTSFSQVLYQDGLLVTTQSTHYPIYLMSFSRSTSLSSSGALVLLHSTFIFIITSPPLHTSIVKYHTQLPTTRTEDHRCRILQECSRLFAHEGTVYSNAPWNFAT